MLPYVNYSLVRTLHEDRIRAARKPVPERIGIAGVRPRQPESAGVRQHVRSSFARALRHLAASLDPQAPTVNA